MQWSFEHGKHVVWVTPSTQIVLSWSPENDGWIAVCSAFPNVLAVGDMDVASAKKAALEHFAGCCMALMGQLRALQGRSDEPSQEGTPVAATLQQIVTSLVEEFEAAVAEAKFRAGGRKGMQVPFHGDFASAVQLPSVVSAMSRWARTIRRALNGG